MNRTLARAREALSSGDFRLLFAARLTSQAGDGLFQAAVLAAVVFTPEEQDTAVGFAKAVALFAVPYSVIGPFTGVFIDRWPRRRILALTPLLRAAAALLTLAGPDAVLPFYAGALIVLSANRFFLSTAGAVMPRLVHHENLLIGNSVATVGGTVATFAGVFAGALASDAVDYRVLLPTIAGLWVAASVLSARIRTSLIAIRASAPPLVGELHRVALELGEGVRRLVRTPRALYPITSITVDQFGQGVLLALSLVVFRERFQEGIGSYSWLIAAGGVGILVGLVTVGALATRWSKQAIVTVAFLISGAALVAVAPVIRAGTMLVASFLLGLSFSWKKIPIDTMVQEAVPDAFRGRIFAVYDLGYNMSRVVAALLVVGLLEGLSVEWAVALTGMLFLAWPPVLLAGLRRAPEVIVRSYAGSRADEMPRSVVLEGTEEAVEVERSWREERGGVRFLCFRLRLQDGRRVEVSRPEEGETWALDRELSGPA
jgi:MFS family permease